MAYSYDERKDVFAFLKYGKGLGPSRDAAAVTPHNTNDLPVYGKLAVFNAHATNSENIRVVPVAATDDANYVDIPVGPGLTVIDWLIVRAVRITGTGADITALLLTS